MSVFLVILIVLLIFGGSGYWIGQGQPAYTGGGIGAVLLIILILYLLQPGLFHR